MQGYIKTYRKILENPIVTKDPDYFAIWNYLLLNATHTEITKLYGGKKIVLKPGQLITGRKSIAAFWGISESKVQRVLKFFESEQQIEQRTNFQHRLVTIINWSEYQQNEQQNEQQMNGDRTANEQRMNTNKNAKNEKNVKNVKYTKKIFRENSEQILKEAQEKYPTKNCKKVLNEFLEQIEIKDYKYTNHKMAFFKWVRISEYLLPKSAVKREPSQEEKLKAEYEAANTVYNKFLSKFFNEKHGDTWQYSKVIFDKVQMDEMKVAFIKAHPVEAQKMKEGRNGL